MFYVGLPFAGYKNPTDTVRKVPKNQNVGVTLISD